MSTSRPLAIVTGASSGLGAEFCRQLARQGYDLAAAARRKERLDALAAELRSDYGANCEVIPVDLAVEEGIRTLEQRIESEPRISLLVNNAGFGARGLLSEVPVEVQHRMHMLHVLATLRLTRAALRVMEPRNRGAIINVSSVASFLQSPCNISYCATKTWITSFTEGVAMELRMTGSAVRIQALCPGFTLTEFHEVMGVGREHAPPAWWMSAEKVVAASLAALDRDQWLVIPGWRYKLLVKFLGLLPRSLLWAPIIRRAGRLQGANAVRHGGSAALR